MRSRAIRCVDKLASRFNFKTEQVFFVDKYCNIIASLAGTEEEVRMPKWMFDRIKSRASREDIYVIHTHIDPYRSLMVPTPSDLMVNKQLGIKELCVVSKNGFVTCVDFSNIDETDIREYFNETADTFFTFETAIRRMNEMQFAERFNSSITYMGMRESVRKRR
mgnify:CR=1 FL=1